MNVLLGVCVLCVKFRYLATKGHNVGAVEIIFTVNALVNWD